MSLSKPIISLAISEKKAINRIKLILLNNKIFLKSSILKFNINNKLYKSMNKTIAWQSKQMELICKWSINIAKNRSNLPNNKRKNSRTSTHNNTIKPNPYSLLSYINKTTSFLISIIATLKTPMNHLTNPHPEKAIIKQKRFIKEQGCKVWIVK